MANDISKLKVDNSTYNIKDADARQVLDALGTAATKNSTNSVTTGSTDLVESGAVKTAIDAAVSSAYHAAGPKTVAELTSALLVAANEGDVYNMTTAGVTTSDFVEGSGHSIRIGDNVGVCKINNAYKFDLLSGFVDLTNYVQKSATSGLLKNDGSVDTTITGAVGANTSAISGIKDGTSIDSFGDVETALADKVDKVTGKGLSTNDYTDVDKEKVDKIDVLSTSVSGNPISIKTKSAQLAKDCIITLEPIQAGSGDPSPENMRAISGRNSIFLNDNKKNILSGIQSGGWSTDQILQPNNTRACSVEFFKLSPGKSYVFNASVAGNKQLQYIIQAYQGNTRVSTSWTNAGTPVSNIADGFTYALLLKYSDDSTLNISDISNAQLEEGSTATEYEPYEASTNLTLSFPETVYGGKLNVRSGELVVTHKIVDMGDLEWNYRADDGSTFRASISDKKVGLENIVCEIYKNTRELFADMPNFSIRGRSNVAELIYVKDTTYGTDASAFATGVTGKYIAYELATPYTIQLTPHEISLLLGDNVVTTNGTTINLDYNANGEMASLDDLSGVGESVNSLSDIAVTLDTQLQYVTRNARANITSRLSDLPTAIAEQNLEKYGYKIGDYFTGASGYNYHLADLDPFYAGYSGYATVNTHHIGIVVDTKTNSKWYETGDISNVNYKDSTLHTFLSTTALNNIKSDLTTLFGNWESHLIKHDKLYAKIGGWTWSSTSTQSEYISALTECQVYGSPIRSADNYQQGEGARQLELFRRHAWMRVIGITAWSNVWLRSISTASRACGATSAGSASDSDVTTSYRAVGLILFK